MFWMKLRRRQKEYKSSWIDSNFKTWPKRTFKLKGSHKYPNKRRNELFDFIDNEFKIKPSISEF